MVNDPDDGGWVVWAYAARPGWERDCIGCHSRSEAREIRDYMIDQEGYPVGWAQVRRSSDPTPVRRPTATELRVVREDAVEVLAGLGWPIPENF